MHITVCIAHLVFVLCQPVHSCIEPSLWARVLLEIFYGDLFLSFFDNSLLTFVTRYCPRNCDWCVIHTHVHRRMASNSQYALPPRSSPQKNHRSEVAVMLKTKLKRHILREFPGYWWLFWMQLLLRYGARLFEEERRMKRNNSDFQLFQVCHFKIVITHCYYYCRLGQAL